MAKPTTKMGALPCGDGGEGWFRVVHGGTGWVMVDDMNIYSNDGL